MRILIQGLNFAPELTGIGKFTGELAVFLANAGHAVRVVTTPPYYPHWKVQKNYAWHRYSREKWEEVDVFRCPLWVPSEPGGVKRIIHLASFAVSSFLPMLTQVAWKPHVVLAIAPALISAPIALLVARLSGARAWLHVQDFEIDAAMGLGILPGERFLYPFGKALEAFLLKCFDQVSTISNSMEKLLLQKGVSPDRVTMLPNWVDTDIIYPLSKPSPLRVELNIPSDKIVVLYSGNLGRKQGLENLLQAACILSEEQNITFIVCGDGTARSSLEKQSSNLKNVRFFPLQPVDRLNSLLNLADIHVLPQRSDAADLVMPSKLTGMLASGRAVIATARKGTELAQVVNDVGCVVPPEDPAALADSVQYLARNEKMRSYLGKMGRSFAVKFWSRERVLGDFLNHLSAIESQQIYY
jgi:colanic acid biosynthesis glycosyl transferase WcaI